MAKRMRPSLGMTERQKGTIVEGVVGAVLGLGGYAILRKDVPTAANQAIGYGLAGAGALVLLDALGIDLLKAIGLK